MDSSRINNKQIRFSGAEWYSPGIRVMILGVGGIGSWLSLFLARQGCELHLYDNDSVDETNLSGQLYGIKDINKNKAVSCRDLVNSLTGNTKIHTNLKFESSSPVNDIIFSCFDNMEGRKLAFNKWKETVMSPDRNENFAAFIDGRMLMEQGQIFCVLPNQESIKKYEDSLFDDSEVMEQPCSAKATSHCGAIIAGFMTAVFNNAYVNYKERDEVRDTPAKVEYNLPLLMFETQIKIQEV